MRNYRLFWIFSLFVCMPALVQAQMSQIRDANDLVVRLLGIGNVAIYLLVALGVIFIVYNVVIYIIKPDSPDEKRTATMNVLWGIVGLAIIVSLWGLVNVLVNTFKTNPTVPRSRFPSANISGSVQSYSVYSSSDMQFTTPGQAANDDLIQSWTPPAKTEPANNELDSYQSLRSNYYKPNGEE